MGLLNDKFQDNWIVLTLQSLDADNDTFVDIFDPTINYSGSTLYTAVNLKLNTGIGTIAVTTSSGIDLISGTFNTAYDVVDALNDFYLEGGNTIFEPENIVGFGFDLTAVSDSFTFLSIELPSSPNVVFTATSTPMVAGSRVTVTSESGVTMNEITQELAFQPYKLDNVNIYANTLNQANNQIHKATKHPNGTQYDDYEFPAIKPVQSRFALEDVKLDYIPSPTNSLIYKVDAGESVRLIFKYSHIPIMNIAEIGEEKEIEQPTVQRSYAKPNTLIGIVERTIREERLKELGVNDLSEYNIKKKVASFVVNRKP